MCRPLSSRACSTPNAILLSGHHLRTNSSLIYPVGIAPIETLLLSLLSVVATIPHLLISRSLDEGHLDPCDEN